jgi:hypothetical protein
MKNVLLNDAPVGDALVANPVALKHGGAALFTDRAARE